MASPKQGKTESSRLGLGMAISILVLGLASLSGGLTAAVTVAGRSAITTASLRWLAILLFSSLLFALWGLLYARSIHGRARIPWARALYLAALCHIPLLLGLALVQAVYSDDRANYVYAASVFGQVAYRPLALVGLVAIPGIMQIALLALYNRRTVTYYLPVLAPVGVAVILRFWSLDWQLPFLLHNDERTYLGIAMISWAHGDPNPHRFFNPSLVFDMDIALFNLLGGGLFQTFRVFAAAFGHHVSDPNGTYLVALAARGLTALFGVGTVPLVYLASRDLFGRRTAILASWLMAVSFLHVRNSHYGTNDVDAVFFTMASFLFAVRIYRGGRLRDYLWAGAMGGLATTTKYSAGIFILPILVAHLARAHKTGYRSLLGKTSLAPLAAGYALSGVTFVLGTPYSLLDWHSFISGFLTQASFGSSPWWGQDALPTWWLYLTTLLQGFGAVPLLLVALGVAVMLRPFPWPLALVAIFPAAYFAFMAREQLEFARFAIPMLPFLAILAGYGMNWAAERIGPRPLGLFLVPLLAIAALAQPVVYSVQGNLLMGQEDTRVLADHWIAANLPQGSILLVDDYSDLGPSQGWPSIRKLRANWFKPTVDPTPWKKEPGRPVYVMLSSFGYEGMLRSPVAARVGELYGPTEQQGKLVAYFAEGYNQQRVGYSQDDTYTPFWHIFDRERPGPAVSIYRFD